MLGNCFLRNPTDTANEFDKGALCETLLFFNRAHLLIDMATLGNIIKAGFLDEITLLLKEGYLTGNYSPQAAVMFNETKGGLREHFFTVMRVCGDQTKPNMRNPELLEQQLQRALDDRGKARKHFRQLADLITFKDMPDNGLPSLARDDICDPFIATQVAHMALQKMGVPMEEFQNCKIEVLPLDGFRFAISTNLDFERIRQFVPESDRQSFCKDNLFPAISDARLDISVAANHNAAFVGNEANRTIVDMILRRNLGSCFDSTAARRSIYDYISVATPSIREVINSGERTTTEFVKLLKKATPFQKWMNQQNPNADLLTEMLREKAGTDWLDSLPAKTIRFGLFTGGGFLSDLVAPGSGVAVSAADSFIIEKFRKNWRPHYFVENHLRGFLEKASA